MQERSRKDVNVITANITNKATDEARLVKNPAVAPVRLAGRARADYHPKGQWR